MAMYILHIVGARPNFMKAAPVMKALAERDGISQNGGRWLLCDLLKFLTPEECPLDSTGQRSMRKILFIQSRSLRDWIKTLQAFGHKCSYRE